MGAVIGHSERRQARLAARAPTSLSNAFGARRWWSATRSYLRQPRWAGRATARSLIYPARTTLVRHLGGIAGSGKSEQPCSTWALVLAGCSIQATLTTLAERERERGPDRAGGADLCAARTNFLSLSLLSYLVHGRQLRQLTLTRPMPILEVAAGQTKPDTNFSNSYSHCLRKTGLPTWKDWSHQHHDYNHHGRPNA